ncbi:hypothetical protein LTR48_006267, partial [Friedmanniomyces endolithicus]
HRDRGPSHDRHHHRCGGLYGPHASQRLDGLPDRLYDCTGLAQGFGECDERDNRWCRERDHVEQAARSDGCCVFRDGDELRGVGCCGWRGCVCFV